MSKTPQQKPKKGVRLLCQVLCRGKRHRIGLTKGGALVLLDHNYAVEKKFAELGNTCRCMELLHDWGNFMERPNKVGASTALPDKVRSVAKDIVASKPRPAIYWNYSKEPRDFCTRWLADTTIAFRNSFSQCIEFSSQALKRGRLDLRVSFGRNACVKIEPNHLFPMRARVTLGYMWLRRVYDTGLAVLGDTLVIAVKNGAHPGVSREVLYLTARDDRLVTGWGWLVSQGDHHHVVEDWSKSSHEDLTAAGVDFSDQALRDEETVKHFRIKGAGR